VRLTRDFVVDGDTPTYEVHMEVPLNLLVRISARSFTEAIAPQARRHAA
jgi:hypothetical protein